MPTSYRVFRSAGRLRTERISEREADLLSSLVAGRCFADACELAQAQAGTDLTDLAVEAALLLVDASRLGLVLRSD
jgi:hypothetical protein